MSNRLAFASALLLAAGAIGHAADDGQWPMPGGDTWFSCEHVFDE